MFYGNLFCCISAMNLMVHWIISSCKITFLLQLWNRIELKHFFVGLLIFRKSTVGLRCCLKIRYWHPITGLRCHLWKKTLAWESSSSTCPLSPSTPTSCSPTWIELCKSWALVNGDLERLPSGKIGKGAICWSETTWRSRQDWRCWGRWRGCRAAASGV